MYVYCILLSCQAVGFPKDLVAAGGGSAPSPLNSAPCFNKTRTFCLAIGRHLDVLAKLVQAKPPRRRHRRRAVRRGARSRLKATDPNNTYARARVPVSE